MANIITLVRIVISVIMLFLPALSPTFFLLYITAGITDIADGAVARRTGTAGKRGSKLDTAADTVFTAVCMIKLLPVMRIPTGIYIWIAVIAAIKVMNIAEGYIRRKELVAVHSAMNRVTGVILYFSR